MVAFVRLTGTEKLQRVRALRKPSPGWTAPRFHLENKELSMVLDWDQPSISPLPLSLSVVLIWTQPWSRPSSSPVRCLLPMALTPFRTYPACCYNTIWQLRCCKRLLRACTCYRAMLICTAGPCVRATLNQLGFLRVQKRERNWVHFEVVATL